MRQTCGRRGLFLGRATTAFALTPVFALTPAYDGACHNRQSSPTGESSYHLADDCDDVGVPQGWDQELEDLRTDNSACSS